MGEDVQRGEGNVTFACMSGGSCIPVVIPMESPLFSLGSTTIENGRVRFMFSSPLTDASTFKIVVDEGALRDMWSNPFKMDTTCESWFQPHWETIANPCPATYTFSTPS